MKGNLSGLLQQGQRMQHTVPQELAKLVTGEAGGGLVKVTMTAIRSPRVIDPYFGMKCWRIWSRLR
jgi:DNA-binding protein YbaB